MVGHADAWKAFHSEPRSLMADLVVSGLRDDEITEHDQKPVRSALISSADKALYTTKERGRNRFVAAESEVR